ncbi:MAG TPA: hypothetical protein VF945_03705 [Polyangia bacterium]
MRLGGKLHPRWRRLFARLHREEGGNVIVIYVAASLLLVGMVWALIGTGARVVQHETIQSSADAAAFSASVIKAKGLNIIAFCNLIMALLLALVMLLRAIKYALIGLAVVVSICAAIPVVFNPLEPACAALAPDLDEFAGQTYPQLEDKAERFIKIAMKGLSVTERAVAHITPILAFAEAYHIGTDGAYKRNFGGGELVTVAWPLPIEGLPVKDATCKDLADNAKQYIGDIANMLLGKLLSVLHVPSVITGMVSSAIQAIVSPLAGTLCGGSATIDVAVKKTSTDCGTCQSAKNIKLSTWTGKQVWRNSDMPQDQWKGTNPGSINHMVDGTCQMQSMPSWSCPGSGSTIGSPMVGCDSDTSGKKWQGMQFQSCLYQDTEQQKVTGESDWPPALIFTDDWKSKVNTRAFTVLSDTKMSERRSSVNVAARPSQRNGTAPMVNEMLGMAQGEWMAWNGHEDLWHMDWRARLVPFTFGNTADGDTSSASDVPAGASGLVSKVVNDFLGKSGMSSLKDQFLLH